MTQPCKKCGEPLDRWKNGFKRGHQQFRYGCRSCERRRGLGKAASGSAARWHAANPEKISAQRLVQRAVRTGGLVRKPCERCGTTEKVHGHHEDYDKPLEVMWLCPKHHRERHRELASPYIRRRGRPIAKRPTKPTKEETKALYTKRIHEIYGEVYPG